MLRVGVYGALAVALAAAFGLWLAHDAATEQARESALVETRAIAQRLAAGALPAPALQEVAAADLAARLDALFGRQTLGGAIVRVTILDRRGRITYSTNHDLIGTRANIARVPRVLDGEEWLARTRLDDGTDVMTSYVRLRQRLVSGDVVSGVLAVYHDYAVVARDVRDATLLQASTMGFALLLLYAASFPIVKRMTRTLAERNRRLEAEAAALRSEEAQYRLVVETAADGVCLLDTVGRVAFVNDKLADLLGRTPLEIVNRPLAELVHVAHRDRLDEGWLRRRHVAGDEREVVLARADGSAVATTVSASPVEEGGAYLGALLMFDAPSLRP